jgi:hypothetical protein
MRLLSSAAHSVTPTSLSPKWVHASRVNAQRLFESFFGDDTRESPQPYSADLIARMIPFDRAALERAIDQLIDQLDDASPQQLVGHWPARMILLATALAGSVLALEVMRRRLSAAGELRSRGREPREDLLGFPELPGNWSRG